MKIRSIKAFPISYRLPEGKTVKMGIGRTIKRDAIIVRVETSDGITGFGEAHPGRSPGAVASLIDNTLAPMLEGMEATDCNGVWQRVDRMQLSSHGVGSGAALALSGIDIALWDIRGKAANMPLYRLLGGRRRRVAAYAGGIALGFQPADALVDEARGYMERGFKALKLRLGDNVTDDTLRLRKVRAALGDAVEVLTDVNTAYTIADVRRLMPALAEVRAGWLEEPFPCQNFAAYRAAAALSPGVPLAAGENHYTRFEFARLLEDKAVQIWQPDLSKTGGVTEGLRIAALASAYCIPVHAHSSATGINHVATVHFLTAIDNGGYFEACVSPYNPMRDMFGPVCRVDADGCVEAPEKPGLGIDVDLDVLRKYPLIDGPGYIV